MHLRPIPKIAFTAHLRLARYVFVNGYSSLITFRVGELIISKGQGILGGSGCQAHKAGCGGCLSRRPSLLYHFSVILLSLIGHDACVSLCYKFNIILIPRSTIGLEFNYLLGPNVDYESKRHDFFSIPISLNFSQ